MVALGYCDTGCCDTVLSQYWGIVTRCYHSTGVLCHGVTTVLGYCAMVLPQCWGIVTRCYHSTGVL